MRNSGISFLTINGTKTVRERQDAVDMFNTGRVQVIVLSPAGSEGLDLKCCESVIIFDDTWNDARLMQATARAVRVHSHDALPLERRKVVVHYIVSRPANRDDETKRMFEMDPECNEDLLKTSTGDEIMRRLRAEKSGLILSQYAKRFLNI